MGNGRDGRVPIRPATASRSRPDLAPDLKMATQTRGDPPGVSGAPAPAGLPRRLAALALDALLAGGAAAGATWATAYALWGDGAAGHGSPHRLAWGLIWLCGYAAVLPSVAGGACIARWGASPGGLVFGLRARTAAHARVGPGRALARASARTLETLACFAATVVALWAWEPPALVHGALLSASLALPFAGALRRRGAPTAAEWLSGTRTVRPA